MASRRMISHKIVSSAKFLKMPISTQALYFQLIVNADDDGVVEAFTIMRIIGASEDDLKVLVAKEFVQVLNEDLVTLIFDWREHNKLRPDRKVNSIYTDLILEHFPSIELLGKKQRSDRQPNDEPSSDRGQSQGQLKDGIGEVSSSVGEVSSSIVENNTTPNPKGNNIYEHWQKQNIIIHKKNTFKGDIKTALNKYSEEDIIKAIDTYSEVYKGTDTWFTHRWGLGEFLSRDKALKVFVDKEVSDYKISSNSNTGYQSRNNCPEPTEEDLRFYNTTPITLTDEQRAEFY